MKTVFESIKAKTKEREKVQGSFILPDIEGFKVVTNENLCEGSTLLSMTYFIGNETENITIDYVSKDNCRSFQVNSNKNIVKIAWKKDGVLIDSFDAIWEDRM